MSILIYFWNIIFFWIFYYLVLFYLKILTHYNQLLFQNFEMWVRVDSNPIYDFSVHGLCISLQTRFMFDSCRFSQTTCKHVILLLWQTNHCWRNHNLSLAGDDHRRGSLFCMQVHRCPAAATGCSSSQLFRSMKYFHTHLFLLAHSQDETRAKPVFWNNTGCACFLMNCVCLCVLCSKATGWLPLTLCPLETASTRGDTKTNVSNHPKKSTFF